MYGMERTTVYLTEAQKRALERAARLSGRSEAELIREGVEVVTGRHQIAEPVLPLFESGQPDLACRNDTSATIPGPGTGWRAQRSAGSTRNGRPPGPATARKWRSSSVRRS